MFCVENIQSLGSLVQVKLIVILELIIQQIQIDFQKVEHFEGVEHFLASQFHCEVSDFLILSHELFDLTQQLLIMN